MSNLNNIGEGAQSGSIGPVAECLNSPRPLIIRAGDREVPICASSIRDHEQRATCVNQFEGQQQVVCDIQSIRDWSADDRRCILPFCHLLNGVVPNTRYLGREGESEVSDLFELTIELIGPGSSPSQCERAIWAATEVAALFHPESVTAACNQILTAIRTHGLRGYRIERLIRHANDFISSMHSTPGDSTELLLSAVWTELTGVNGMVVPAGWTACSEGISRSNADVSFRINAPIVIRRRMREARGGKCFVELGWRRLGIWRHQIFPRETLASTRNIVGLATYDIPVNSSNATDLIEYLDASEARNLNLIPEAIVSDRMGWSGEEGIDGFLFGRQLLGLPQSSGTRIEGVQQSVEFQGADQGDEQLADSLQARGDFEAWRNLVTSVRDLPRVLLGIYTSFVPPLLMILRSHSFILSYAGPTSGGKTTTLGGAAATWGCPDQQEPESFMKNWDMTRVGLERVMQILDGIPIVVDDTKQARSPEDIAQAVYDVTGGRGRIRGTERGLAATKTWRSAMITSGEQPLASFSQDGGTRARIVELWNSPFGNTSEEMAQRVTELKDGFCQHYGHAGPRFVEYLIANRSLWDEWRLLYQQSRGDYERRARNNNVAARLSTHLAAIETAAYLVHFALQLPWQYEGTVESLWAELTQDSAEADRAAAAMRMLLNFCATHRHLFVGGEAAQDPTRPVPFGGFVGHWSHRSTIGEPHECRVVYVQVVNELLTKDGYEPQSLKRMWRDRGWTTTNPDKTTLKMRLMGDAADVIAIPVRVIAELMDNDVPPNPPQPRGITVGNGVSRTREQGENTHNT